MSIFYLCYCDQCGKLVLPPRDAPADPDVEKVKCRACAPGAVAAAPASHGSGAIPVGERGVTRESRSKIATASRAPQAVHHPSSTHAAHSGEKRRVAATPPPKAANTNMIYAAAGGGAAVLILLIFMMTRGGKTEAVAKKDPIPETRPAQTYTPDPVAPPPVMETPKPLPVKAPETATTLPVLPAVNTQVPPEKTPPAVDPKVIPAKVETPATALNLKPLEDAAANAKQLCERKQFTAATALLDGLKATYGAEPTFVAATEQVTQARAAFFKRLDDAQETANTTKDAAELKVLLSEWAPGQTLAAPEPPKPVANPADGWVAVDAEKVYSDGGATFTKEDNGAIFVSGKNADKDSYYFEGTLPVRGITGVRLETLADPRLPKGGPGRFAANGHFAMSNARVTFNGADPDWDRINMLEDVHPADSRMLVDNNVASHWVNSQTGKDHWAVYYARRPCGDAGQKIVLKMDFDTSHDQHTVGKFRVCVTTKIPPPDGFAPLVGAVVAGPAPLQAAAGMDAEATAGIQKLLKSIEDRQAFLIDEQNKAAWVALNGKFDEWEKQSKLRLTGSQVEAVLKQMAAEAEPELLKSGAAFKKFSERYVALKVDLLAQKGGELAAFRGKSKVVNGVVDLTYDFATPDDFGAWSWDDPTGQNQAFYEAAKQRVVIKAQPGKYWHPTGDRWDAPMLKIPFPFKGQNWSIECDLDNINLSDKKEFGSQATIGLWDGGKRYAWVQALEDQAKNAKIALCVLDGTERWENSGLGPTRFNETYRVRFSCVNGVLSTVFASKRGGTAITTPGKLALPFDPVYLVLTVRTSEMASLSSAGFSKFTLKALLDTDKIKVLSENFKKSESTKILQELTAKAAVSKP